MNPQLASGPAGLPPQSRSPLDLSIVIPLFNEQESILPLYEGLMAVLRGLHRTFEIIFINDGSVDDSYGVLCRLAEKDGHVKVITYWCDVCSIRTYTPGPCWCCQKETLLDLRDPDQDQ